MKRTCCATDLKNQIAPDSDFTRGIEARDFLAVYLPKLSAAQQRVLLAWSNGHSAAQIAVSEGISATAAHERIRCAMRRLRQIAESSGGKHTCAVKCRCR